MHPGLWLAFGDISGHDFWRNKARIRHAGFVKEPFTTETHGGFSVWNEYVADGQIICEEICRIAILPRPAPAAGRCGSTESRTGGKAGPSSIRPG